MYNLSEQEINLILDILKVVPVAGPENQVNALSAGAKLRGQLEALKSPVKDAPKKESGSK